MKPFNDTYVMYQLLEFIDENSIICLCKASKKLNKICKNYIELEDDKRFELEDDKRFEAISDSKLLHEYCEYNNVIKIRKMFGIDLDWNIGLYGACIGGHIDIIKALIEKGATDWNSGLFHACFGGHIDIVKFLIEKGAYDWNWGLYHACRNGHIDIVKLMIEKGAIKCGYGMRCKKSMEEHLKK